jgi:tetratricopeptide (TPR) repeat protein
MPFRDRAHASILVALLFIFASSCGKTPTPEHVAQLPATGDKPAVSKPPLKNEIPADKLNAVIPAHLKGLGYMEQYEYRKAAKEFREVRALAPGWIPGSINLAIALLNDVGQAQEDAKKKGQSDTGADYSEPLVLLDEVLTRDPQNPHAYYCRGLILEVNGQTAEANASFKKVTELDPKDGHAWYKLGATLMSTTEPTRPAGIEDADRLLEIFSTALERSPYLLPAMYRLQLTLSMRRIQLATEFEKRQKAGEVSSEKAAEYAKAQAELTRKQSELLARLRRLNPKETPTGTGDSGESSYGESGKYSLIIDPFRTAPVSDARVPAPRFDNLEPIKVTLPEGSRWVKAEDFVDAIAVIGRARARFGATVVSLDINADGRSDLFLAAAVKGPKGVRDVLLLNKSDGVFEDVSAAWGLPDDRASIGAAAADFDADRKIDLFLTGLDDNHLLRNVDGSKFEDVTSKVGIAGSKALGLTARWLDIDQDGDLDLYVVNYTDRASAGLALSGDPANLPKVSNVAYRNDGRPSGDSHRPEASWAPLAVATGEHAGTAGLSLKLTVWPDAEALHGPPAHYSAAAAIYLDNDRDIDMLLVADGEVPRAVLNDRLGKFHAVELKDLTSTEPVSGLIVTDFDKDGRADVAMLSTTAVVKAWRNTTDELTTDALTWQPWPTDSRTWRMGIAADLDLDSWSDLVGLPAKSEVPTLDWARNDGKRLINQLLPFVNTQPLAGFTLADLVDNPLPDLLVLADDSPPRVARNLGNGEHWLALDLGGRWKVHPDYMRTNPNAIGTRISLEGQGLFTCYDLLASSSGLGQSIGPIVLGLGKSPSADLVRFRWPDGTIQCELNKAADVLLPIAEYSRKTGSCPVLFTWNGERFVCLGDFLGGGGLGYLVAPGVYSQPDPDESVAISGDQLKSVNGVFRLVVTEPMDEVAYLDALHLEVIDRPPGVSVGLDERFAPEGLRPTGEVVAWKSAVVPVRATDLKGRDVARTLAAFDRDTVSDFRKLNNWIGYAENHGIVLDFGDRLSYFNENQPLLLALAGWVEYPYSQTNYAASTAGVSLQPPTIERLQEDGTWKLIEPHAGYPAGMPRMTTLDLTGKLIGPRCVIRLQTNMECYWDQAFIAVRDRSAEASLKRATLPVARAVLEHRGYTREVSPDGRLPLLYDYDHVDPSPLALMGGKLTRLGDVATLLQQSDDRLCVVGPGDKVRIEFAAGDLPALPEGWSRSYVLKSFGYCKDADPFTAGSDDVEPLPWRGMPPFPFAAGTRRPDDPAHRAYLGEFQTRPAGSRSMARSKP